MPDSPQKVQRKQKRQQRAKKVVTVASVVAPEAKAAKAGMAAKARSAKSAARAGEKGASKLSRTKTSAPRTSSKTEAKPGSVSTPAGQKSKNPATPARESSGRTSGSKRAVQYAKRETGRRVQSARTEHAKTSSAVRSKYRRDKVIGLAEMRPKTRMLAAEFMAAIVIAVIFLFVGDKSYHEKMSRFFVQITGITGIFFFLALIGNSEKAGKWVVPFGLLIDLSMVGYLMRSQGGTVITNALGGKAKLKPNKPGSGEPTPTPNEGGTGGPIRVVSAETYNAPHPGGSGLPPGTEPIWPGTTSPIPGGGTVI